MNLNRPSPLRHAHTAVLLVAATCTPAHSDGFETFSRPEQLEGNTIVSAGNIIRMPNPTLSTSDSFAPRPPQWYQLGPYCFTSTSLDEIGGKAGILMVDRRGTASLAVLSESIGSIKVATYQPAVYDCVKLMKQQNQQWDEEAKRQLEALKRQSDSLKKFRESLKQKNKDGGSP